MRTRPVASTNTLRCTSSQATTPSVQSRPIMRSQNPNNATGEAPRKWCDRFDESYDQTSFPLTLLHVSDPEMAPFALHLLPFAIFAVPNRMIPLVILETSWEPPGA